MYIYIIYIYIYIYNDDTYDVLYCHTFIKHIHTYTDPVGQSWPRGQLWPRVSRRGAQGQ